MTYKKRPDRFLMEFGHNFPGAEKLGNAACNRLSRKEFRGRAVRKQT